MEEESDNILNRPSILHQATLLHASFSMSTPILDLESLKPNQPIPKLITDDDLQLSRKDYSKPVKHGVVNLDEKVFCIITNSLLQSKKAGHSSSQEWVQDFLQQEKDTGDINMVSKNALLKPTYLPP